MLLTPFTDSLTATAHIWHDVFLLFRHISLHGLLDVLPPQVRRGLLDELGQVDAFLALVALVRHVHVHVGRAEREQHDRAPRAALRHRRERHAVVVKQCDGPDELRRAGYMLKMGKGERFAAWVTAFDALETSRLYGGARETESRAIEIYGRYTCEADGDMLDRMMYSEVKIRLPECMLSRTDRMTMAASLEGRTPYLDHRIVEWAMSLPSSMKIRGNEEKYILRRALGRVVPRSILDRRKQGLAVPFAQWTRYGIEKHIRRILSTDRIDERGLFHPPYVARLLDHWEPQAAKHSQLIWSLFCLELWFRLYVDEPALDPQTPLSAVA